MARLKNIIRFLCIAGLFFVSTASAVPPATISGRVIFAETDVPVRNAYVYPVVKNGQRTFTDPNQPDYKTDLDGKFTTTAAVGGKAGFQVMSIDGYATTEFTTQPVFLTAKLGNNPVTLTVDTVTCHENSIKGKVVDQTGHWLPGVTVALSTSAGTTLKYATTDDNGDFAFYVPQDIYPFVLNLSFATFAKTTSSQEDFGPFAGYSQETMVVPANPGDAVVAFADRCNGTKTVRLISLAQDTGNLIITFSRPKFTMFDDLEIDGAQSVTKQDLQNLSVKMQRGYALYPKPINTTQLTAANDSAGQGYMRAENVLPGWYSIEIIKNGAIIFSSEVFIKAGDNRINATLPPSSSAEACAKFTEGMVAPVWLCGKEANNIAADPKFAEYFQTLNQEIRSVRLTYNLPTLPKQIVIFSDKEFNNAFYYYPIQVAGAACTARPKNIKVDDIEKNESLVFTTSLFERGLKETEQSQIWLNDFRLVVNHELGHGKDLEMGRCQDYLSNQPPFNLLRNRAEVLDSMMNNQQDDSDYAAFYDPSQHTYDLTYKALFYDQLADKRFGVDTQLGGHLGDNSSETYASLFMGKRLYPDKLNQIINDLGDKYPTGDIGHMAELQGIIEELADITQERAR